MRVPDHIRQWVAEADRLGAAGRFEPAIALYQKVLRERPDLADSWYNLGFLQRQARQFEPALASYQQALARGVQGPEEVHLNRAVILTDQLRDDAAAERELREALRLEPGYLPALQNLANLHTDQGRRDEAASLYEKILTVAPGDWQSLARFAQLREFRSAADPMIARLEAALRQTGTTPADQASLGFALVRALDQAGEHRRAFAAAMAANQASRASVRPPPVYDRRAHEAFVDQIIAAFPRPLAAPAEVSGTPAKLRPIFICGMFRSGSTLAEQLLTGDPTVASGGELDLLRHLVHSRVRPFPQALSRLPAPAGELSAIAREYRAQLAGVFPQAAAVTDKRLDNFYYLGLIRALFPDARLVHTTRDPLDMALSIYFLHLDPAMSFALDLADIAHYYRQYRRVMDHWQQLFGEAIFELNYDSLVRSPGTIVPALFGHCDLTWHQERLNFASRQSSIKTASVWQVREPLYQRSSGRATKYAPELAQFKRELQPGG